MKFTRQPVSFIHVNEDKNLPARTDEGPPLLREHRLYQADWLLRYYHFEAKELLSEENPNFNILLDPKCNWALRNLEVFPVEVNRASYEMLLRVPGLGYKSAMRIVKARRLGTLDFPDLKILNTKERLPQGVAGMTYRQLSLFDDVKFGGGLHEKDVYLHG